MSNPFGMTDEQLQELALKIREENEERKRKELITLRRVDEVLNRLNSVERASLVMRLINQNGKNWKEFCYSRGCQPYPTNALGALWTWIENNAEKVDPGEIQSGFPQIVYYWNGFYFRTMHGQGVVHNIFDSKFRNLLSI